MADFVAPPQPQAPNLLGQFLAGQQGAQQAAMFPGQMQLQGQAIQGGQQDIAAGGLKLDQLRIAMKNQHMYQDVAQQQLRSQGFLGGQAAQPASGPSGGVQSGPQASTYGDTSGGNSGQMFSPGTLSALALLRGDDPLTTAKGVQEYQQKQTQLQMQGPMALMDTLATSPDADKIVAANPQLQTQWTKVAPLLGLNPLTDGTPENIRAAAVYAYNGMAGKAGLPTHPMPDKFRNVNLGNGEVGQISAVTGKKVGDLIDRQNPSYSLVDKYDPATNSTSKIPVQTGGYGMGGVNPSTGAGGGPGGPRGFDAGMKAPTDSELKSGMFASEMRAGLNTMTKMEDQGFSLSPKTRTLLINAATSEDEGAIKQFMSQEALTHMSKQEQTYIAALMPVLQAAGHDQSGARLTTSQVRQNVESLLPVDVKNKDALTQVNANRQGFYVGLLGQAGSASQLPQYKKTLGSDLAAAQGKGNAPASAVSYLKSHPETADHFKQKYGYLPGG